MLNSKPNNSNYNQGNYVPKNKEKSGSGSYVPPAFRR